MLTLALDTAASVSVAITADGQPIAESFCRSSSQHAATLLPLVEDVCHRAGVNLPEIELFACTTGPGSFTGLRIGMATVKGFVLATGRPLVGVSTLVALAANATPTPMRVCPLLDARHGHVYTAPFRLEAPGLPVMHGKERLAELSSLLASITEDCLFLGDGAVAYGGRIRALLPARAHLAPAYACHVRAAVVATLAEQKFQRGDLLDPLTAVPQYLRAAEAERKAAEPA